MFNVKKSYVAIDLLGSGLLKTQKLLKLDKNFFMEIFKLRVHKLKDIGNSCSIEHDLDAMMTRVHVGFLYILAILYMIGNIFFFQNPNI